MIAVIYTNMRKKGIMFLFILSTLITKAQELKPTMENALLKTFVTNELKKPIAGDQVVFTSKSKSVKFKGVTDTEGRFSILVPIGDTYLVEYSNFTNKVKFNEITIPAEPALYSWDVNISFEPARVIVLENVEYDFNKSTIRKSSFKTLDDLYEVMSYKPNLVIEIGGHTDNIGTDKSNELLSLNRSNSIKSYLIKKGIPAERIQTKGYGESVPIADNDTEEGRQKNRRTEVKIIKE